eukprot:GFUD01045166.1.p1 GENE.GFUD01045166.1~~GFUD01045166.1.p1  ORF type:complete len:108 (+),score=28.66 GFUD01045166.1:300-623(+)
MFSFKPNPHYVPGGVTNFWLSGSSASGESSTVEVERSDYGRGADGDGGAVLKGMGKVGGGDLGAFIRTSFSYPQKDESQNPFGKESFADKFAGLMEGFNPQGNTCSV